MPFHYYGIYDDTDYSGLHLIRGRYDEKELNETYIGKCTSSRLDIQVLLQIWIEKKLWDFVAPEHMRRKWQRNSVKEGFLP